MERISDERDFSIQMPAQATSLTDRLTDARASQEKKAVP